MQHLTTQNTTLIEFVKTQLKKIYELVATRKYLMVLMQIQEDVPRNQTMTVNKNMNLQIHKYCK